jgi:hypothetical protein
MMNLVFDSKATTNGNKGIDAVGSKMQVDTSQLMLNSKNIGEKANVIMNPTSKFTIIKSPHLIQEPHEKTAIQGNNAQQAAMCDGNEIKVSFMRYIRFKAFFCCFSSQAQRDFQYFTNARLIIIKKLDVVNYLNQLDIIKNLSKVVLSDEQITALQLNRRINYNSYEDISKEHKKLALDNQSYTEDVNNAVNYFNNKIVNKALSREDARILELTKLPFGN